MIKEQTQVAKGSSKSRDTDNLEHCPASPFLSPPKPIAMTDSDFEDNADFDVNNISNILKDIDNANLALDVMEGWLAQTCVCQPGVPA